MPELQINSAGGWTQFFYNAKNAIQALALVGAGLWAFVTYVLPEILRPADYRPFLVVETELKSLRALPEHSILTLGIRLENSSKRFLHNIAAYYNAKGFKRGKLKERVSVAQTVQQINKQGDGLVQWHRHGRTEIALISFGQLLPNNWSFAPDETSSTQLVMTIPCTVDILWVQLLLHYSHAPEDIFRAYWKYKDGVLKHKTLVLQNGQYVKYKPDEKPEHKRLGEEYGMYWTAARTEVDIPHEARSEDCSVD